MIFWGNAIRDQDVEEYSKAKRRKKGEKREREKKKKKIGNEMKVQA